MQVDGRAYRRSILDPLAPGCNSGQSVKRRGQGFGNKGPWKRLHVGDGILTEQVVATFQPTFEDGEIALILAL